MAGLKIALPRLRGQRAQKAGDGEEGREEAARGRLADQALPMEQTANYAKPSLGKRNG
ncbi:MAG: hypothetical protein HFE80_08920 [Clostridiaceae bacterium]|jgi:hypothetical protein|nr:hypothetical protein [Clostridiaceae bacterium]